MPDLAAIGRPALMFNDWTRGTTPILRRRDGDAHPRPCVRRAADTFSNVSRFFEALSDGTVTIRPPEPGDQERLMAAQDSEFDRWLGAEAEMGAPLACIVVDREVVGWIDFDVHRDWLKPGEVNLGYFLAASARGYGYATRAVELFLHYLAAETDHRVATLLIDLRNERSLAVASRADFKRAKDIGGGAAYFKRAFR
jgi:RimJ/RimL family protein N-acetyltransferase